MQKWYVEIRRTIIQKNSLTYGNKDGKIYHIEKQIGGFGMEKLINHTEKLCSFYVSEWHLATMILPYINKEINEKANITTVLEKDIEENIKLLLSKLNLKNEKEILEIDWKTNQGINYLELDKKLKMTIKKESYCNIIFVNGSKEYIDFINEAIEEWITKNKSHIKGSKIKIINCYEVTEFNNDIKEILDSHDKILNTAGEKYISEVFDGYEIKMA